MPGPNPAARGFSDEEAIESGRRNVALDNVARDLRGMTGRDISRTPEPGFEKTFHSLSRRASAGK